VGYTAFIDKDEGFAYRTLTPGGAPPALLVFGPEPLRIALYRLSRDMLFAPPNQHLDFKMWESTHLNPPASSHRTSFPVGAMVSSDGPANRCARVSTLRASPVRAIPAASRSGTQRRSPPATVIPSISSSNTVRMRT